MATGRRHFGGRAAPPRRRGAVGSGGNDETIRVWRLDDGTRVGEPLQLGGPVRSVAWCQSEQLVLAAGAFGLAALQLR